MPEQESNFPVLNDDLRACFAKLDLPYGQKFSKEQTEDLYKRLTNESEGGRLPQRHIRDYDHFQENLGPLTDAAQNLRLEDIYKCLYPLNGGRKKSKARRTRKRSRRSRRSRK